MGLCGVLLRPFQSPSIGTPGTLTLSVASEELLASGSSLVPSLFASFSRTLISICIHTVIQPGLLYGLNSGQLVRFYHCLRFSVIVSFLRNPWVT